MLPQAERALLRRKKAISQNSLMAILLTSQLLSACGSSATTALPATNASAQAPSTQPDWFNIAMTDVRTGQSFAINDFAENVVLIETMAQWCPNCLFQQGETRNLRQQLDLILISLVLSLLSGALQHQMTSLFARNSRLINAISGLLLIGVASYDIAQNWQLLRLFYAELTQLPCEPLAERYVIFFSL